MVRPFCPFKILCGDQAWLKHNGPAIWGGCVGALKRHGALFAVQVQSFIEHYACRGTSLIGAANLSSVTNLVAGTGAVSRYKLSRSQKSSQGAGFKLRADARVRVQRPLQICLGCRSKAKSVTNNLPILSVLAFVHILSFLMVTKSLCACQSNGIRITWLLLQICLGHRNKMQIN